MFFSLFLSSNKAFTASKQVYTIQICAYSLNNLQVAEKGFEMIKDALTDKELKGLRLLKANSHYLIRIGKFNSKKEALLLLDKIKGLIRDAFVLLETEKNRFSLIKSYNEESDAHKEKPAVENEKINSKTRPATPALVERPETAESEQESEVTPQSFYTVQIANFLKLDDAKKEYYALYQALNNKDRKGLRIERAGKYYSIRIGFFETYTEAREFLKGHEGIFTGVIMQAKLNQENIVLMEDTQETNKGKSNIIKPKKDDESSKIIEVINTVDDYLNTQEYGRAAEVLRKAISEWPDNPDLYALYGEALLYLGYPEKALEKYKRAAELSPDVPDYHAGVGYSLLNIYLDRARASIEAFKRALEIDPENINALEGLGIVYVSMDRKDLAIEIYNRLKELDQESAERLNNIIQNGINLGQ